MSHEEMLNQLKDIHWSVLPSFWPLPFAYYAVFMVLCLMLIVLWAFLRVQKKQRIRREIFHELNQIEAHFRRHNDGVWVQNQLCALVRRLIIHKGASEYKAREFLECEPIFKKIFTVDASFQDFLTMIEHDRFKQHANLDVERMLFLAQRQFKRCRI